jgi:Protein of unknown function (DUF1236)
VRVFRFSLVVLAVAAALAASALLVWRNLPPQAPQSAAREEVQAEAVPADVPTPEDTASIEEAIAAAFALPQQATAPPVEPFIAKPAGAQASPYEPLILPPSGLSGGNIVARLPEPETAPRAKRDTVSPDAPLNLSPAQQEKVRYVLQSHNILQSEVVDFPLRVGTAIPKEVDLLPLPIELVSVVPNYRNYSYAFMQDRIVIVATNSREIGLILPF